MSNKFRSMDEYRNHTARMHHVRLRPAGQVVSRVRKASGAAGTKMEEPSQIVWQVESPPAAHDSLWEGTKRLDMEMEIWQQPQLVPWQEIGNRFAGNMMSWEGQGSTMMPWEEQGKWTMSVRDVIPWQVWNAPSTCASELGGANPGTDTRSS